MWYSCRITEETLHFNFNAGDTYATAVDCGDRTPELENIPAPMVFEAREQAVVFWDLEFTRNNWIRYDYMKATVSKTCLLHSSLLVLFM